jgi:site-specific DNA-cytosine methylase
MSCSSSDYGAGQLRQRIYIVGVQTEDESMLVSGPDFIQD